MSVSRSPLREHGKLKVSRLVTYGRALAFVDTTCHFASPVTEKEKKVIEAGPNWIRRAGTHV